mmetsp:Transcript_26441/g.54766  ORF Transcript_26441/g.54766 Transcript_26441/m.54766 type:complete len:280 (-) Transcript_26441:110-949(-)
MSLPSKLDLSGQASEDEPCLFHADTCSHMVNGYSQQQRVSTRLTEEQPAQKSTHEQQKHAEQATNTPECSRSSNSTRKRAQNPQQSERDRNPPVSPPPNQGILARIPSLLDLFHNPTPISLLLLPFVFFIYLLLQLPLHYNSSSSWYDSTNDPSRLTPQEWQNRSDQVSKMQQDLQTIETKMENVKEGQDGLQGEVKSLRRRLEKIRKMREEREEWMRKQLELKIKEAEQIRLEKVQLATNGVANTGPIATISMAKALAVATFVGGGKEISQDESKKSY